MKALSVKQPWAGNIALSLKKAEIRSRFIKPQGDILICSSIKPMTDYNKYTGDTGLYYTDDAGRTKMFGMALAVVCWDDSIPFTEDICNEAMFDPKLWPFEFEKQQWAWIFLNARKIKPFPIRGQLGLFEADDNLIHYV